MIDETLAALADEITRTGPSGQQPGIRLRQGTIVSVQANGTATITIGGDTTEISGVRVASHVCPVPGATCWLAVDGRDLFVIATLAPAGPAHGEMERSTAQAIASNTFTAISWANRAGTVERGVTLGSSGITVLVPGIYQVNAGAIFQTSALGDNRIIRLLRNGSAVDFNTTLAAPNGNAFARMSASGAFTCAANDVINFEVWHNTGGNLDIAAGSARITSTWLGPEV